MGTVTLILASTQVNQKRRENLQISRAELEAGSKERVCKGGHCGRVLDSVNTLALCLWPSPSPALSEAPRICHLRLLAEFERATQKKREGKKKERKKVQPTQQTLLLSWILTFSFFCVFVVVFPAAFYILQSPFSPLRNSFCFSRHAECTNSPHVIFVTRASFLRNGVLWGPKWRRARTPCTWTSGLFVPVARAVRLKALRLRAPPAQLSCSFYFPQSPAHSLELQLRLPEDTQMLFVSPGNGAQLVTF